MGGGTLAGDVNGDGALNVLDAILILRAASGAIALDPARKAAADLNGDGKIDVLDAILALRRVVGRR